MTVASLIYHLSQFPDNAEVVISGHEGGYSLVESLEQTKIKHQGYYCSYAGSYEIDEDGDDAVILST